MLHPLGDKLWWADQGTDQIGTCDKKDGGSWKVLRNSTSPMMHMKIYNETVQKGAACQLFLKLCNIHFGEMTSQKIKKRAKGGKYVLVSSEVCFFLAARSLFIYAKAHLFIFL